MKHPPHNALIVDWDYFFPIDVDWDWAHAESDFLTHGVWPIRGAAFLERDEPLPTVNDGWKGFFKEWKYSLGCPFYAADSNAAAYLALIMTFGIEIPDVGVWLFDQHHDCGYHGTKRSAEIIYERKGVSCEDWMLGVAHVQKPKRGRLHVVYPDFHEHAFEWEPEPAAPIERRFRSDYAPADFPERFDLVFVCRSGAWVPSWEDRKFERFLKTWPFGEPTLLDELAPREWSLKEARAMAKVISKARGE